MRRASSSVVRGALLGLVAGLLVGGLSLFAVGARTVIAGVDCGSLTPEECALEREITLSFARRQVWVGGALALMGVAVFIWGRAHLTGGRRESQPP